MHFRFFFEVVDGRRRGGRPFQSPGVPWIVARDFATPIRNDEVVSKDQNRYSLDHSSDGDDKIEEVPSTIRLIGIDRPRHSQEPQEVHGVERNVKAYGKEPEMPLAERFVQQASGSFGVPVIDTCEDAEHDGADEDIVEVRNHKIRVMQLPVPRRHREHDAGQSCDQELKEEPNAEEHWRREAYSAAPESGDPIEYLNPGWNT